MKLLAIPVINTIAEIMSPRENESLSKISTLSTINFQQFIHGLYLKKFAIIFFFYKTPMPIRLIFNKLFPCLPDKGHPVIGLKSNLFYM